MLDPVSAVMAATAAYNGVKKLIETGRELEDIAGTLGKWYTAVADFTKTEEELKNPPFWKKITHAKSVEEQALDLLIHKKKLQEQESEIRTMIMYRFGADAYREMIAMRKEIRKEREQQVYKQRKMRKMLVEVAAVIAILIPTLIGFFYAIYWLMNYQT